jgi:hypothetical protein
MSERARIYGMAQAFFVMAAVSVMPFACGAAGPPPDHPDLAMPTDLVVAVGGLLNFAAQSGSPIAAELAESFEPEPVCGENGELRLAWDVFEDVLLYLSSPSAIDAAGTGMESWRVETVERLKAEVGFCDDGEAPAGGVRR